MRYSIRRIGIGSTLRLSLLLGWLVALCPAMCLAGAAVQILRIVGRAILQVETLDITVLGQKIATIDPLALLKLRDGNLRLDTHIQRIIGPAHKRLFLVVDGR